MLRYVDKKPSAKAKPKSKTAPPAPAKPRVGRPRLEDQASTLEATKPWEALNMSRRTWYRRQKETRDAD